MSNPRKDDGYINIMPGDRTVERSQGCWNCRSWINGPTAVSKWTVDRQRDLAHALELAQTLPGGEDNQKVKDIRRMVNTVDHAVAQGLFGICLGGKSETDFVHHAYLCASWTGREGASVAGEGRPMDLLPEELAARLDEKLKKG